MSTLKTVSVVWIQKEAVEGEKRGREVERPRNQCVLVNTAHLGVYHFTSAATAERALACPGKSQESKSSPGTYWP